MTLSAAPSRLSSTLPARIAPVEEIVADLRAGRMVILVDEEDRENEGDLMLAAEHVTSEAINFMATHARGLICLTLHPMQALSPWTMGIVFGAGQALAATILYWTLERPLANGVEP